MKYNKRLDVRVTDKDRERLIAFMSLKMAKNEKVKLSDIVREAIRQYLN